MNMITLPRPRAAIATDEHTRYELAIQFPGNGKRIVFGYTARVTEANIRAILAAWYKASPDNGATFDAWGDAIGPLRKSDRYSGKTGRFGAPGGAWIGKTGRTEREAASDMGMGH